MKAVHDIPENYGEILTVDLQKDKKLAVFINLAAFLIGVLMFVLMHLFIPISALFDFEKGLGMYALRFGVLLVGMILYIVLHEAVHGIFMKLYGAKSVRFGFTGLYAFAGSERDCFGKGPYLVIALAPVVLFGVLLALLQAFLPLDAPWLWVIYIIQTVNVSGAAGDLFVTLRFLSLPRDILVRDTGTAMTVYAPKPQ